MFDRHLLLLINAHHNRYISNTSLINTWL